MCPGDREYPSVQRSEGGVQKGRLFHICVPIDKTHFEPTGRRGPGGFRSFRSRLRNARLLKGVWGEDQGGRRICCLCMSRISIVFFFNSQCVDDGTFEWRKYFSVEPILRRPFPSRLCGGGSARGDALHFFFPAPYSQSSLAKREFSLGRRTATDIVWTATRRPPFVPPPHSAPGANEPVPFKPDF